MRDRFDFPPYPNTWIPIGWSRELSRGAVEPLTCVGREFVLFRGQDGKANVLDAHCPHLGAHLGVGGCVVDNEIRCPFHGWQFNGAGACTRIGHGARIPPKARLRPWDVREANGVIFLWHDASGRPPWFEIPSLPEDDAWSAPRYFSVRIKTRWREIMENAVDRVHFQALHDYPGLPELELRTDGARFSMTSHVPWRRFGLRRTVRLDVDAYGAGFAITHGAAEFPFRVVGCSTPLDEDTVLQRMSFQVSRRIPLPLRGIAARLMARIAVREFRRDIPIWENKVSLSRPALSAGDGPIARFRSWAAQFHAPAIAA